MDKSEQIILRRIYKGSAYDAALAITISYENTENILEKLNQKQM